MMIEIDSLRTHDTKHYLHPTEPGKRVCIQSSGLLHAKTDAGFVDIRTEMPDFNFPEGKEIPAGTVLAKMLDLPDWGTPVLGKDGKTVRVLDKDGVSIFRYVSPRICPKGELPFRILSKNPTALLRTAEKEEYDPIKETLEVNPNAKDCLFELDGNALMMRLPKAEALAVSAFDATDTTSTNAADTSILKDYPTYNGGSDTYGRAQRYSDGNFIRSLMRWTTPASLGTITAIKLYVWAHDIETTAKDVSIYNCLRTDWVESEATWNIYKTGNNWTTAGCSGAGTDYDSTAIDVIATPASAQWVNFALYGTGADAPITPGWSTTYNFMLRSPEDATGGFAFFFKEYTTDTSKRPYLEITYTPDLSPSVFDAVTVTESVTVAPSLSPSADDQVTVSETVVACLENGVSVFDAVSISETVSLELVSTGPSASDQVAVSESVTVLVADLVPSVFDAVTAAESVTVSISSRSSGLVHMRSTEQSSPLMMDEDETR